MVLQDKYKARASRAWKSSRGLSTAAKPGNRRPPPPSVNDNNEFPELQRGSSSGSDDDNSGSASDVTEDAAHVAGVPAASSSRANDAKLLPHPKFSRRRLVDNSSRYDEPTTEDADGRSSEEETDLSSFMMKSASVDDDFDQYSRHRAVAVDDDDIDHDLADRHKQKERQVLRMDAESTEQLEKMSRDRVNAEAAWTLKSRLRGESGRQYIQRYESSKKKVDHLDDADFFDSTDNAHVSSEAVAGKDDEIRANVAVSSTISATAAQDLTKDQDFLDDLL
ncbi:hypothetical protein E3P99_00102 [Wallemia hederae]|uniref:Uncharacterized protein n=1 Tax=Wallemia hederae TaxID=1540922 RepID=A0A4T0FXL9_9BASI|nr:hypothetical protein E3P99_00102 [Wallemia hederae]